MIYLREPSSVVLSFVQGFLSFSSALILGLFLSLGFHISWLISLQELGFPNVGLLSLYFRIRVCVDSILFSLSLVNLKMVSKLV